LSKGDFLSDPDFLFYPFGCVVVSSSVTDRQRDSSAKFLYDLAKGVGLISVVGASVSGQVSGTSVIVGLLGMAILFFGAYWLEGRGT
jgi:hypothetical protein